MTDGQLKNSHIIQNYAMLSGMDVCLAKLNGFLEELIDLEYPKQ